MKRRGFVFTLDAILAVVLLMMFVTSILAIQSQTVNVYTTYSRTQDKYIAENVLHTLRTTPLRELVPPDVISKWIEDGVLNTTVVSPDMSPIDIVATYWATAGVYNNTGFKTDAEIIMGYILNNTLKGYNYELFIDNYTSPYLLKGNSSVARDISPATLLISGYSPNQTPRGYMARAFLTKVEVERQDLFGWFRVLAAPYYLNKYYYAYRNSLSIERIITLPEDAVPLSADALFVQRRAEGQRVVINGWAYPSSGYTHYHIYLGSDVLTGHIQRGDNNVTLFYGDGSLDQDGIGSASGTTLYVDYKSNSTSVSDPGLVKIYRVDSKHTGFFYLLEMFVPGNVTEINMKFKVQGVHKVNLYYGFGGDLVLLSSKAPDSSGIVEFTDSDIENAVDQKLCGGSDCYDEFKANLSKMVFDFVLGFDAVYDPYSGHWEYGGGYCQLSSTDCNADESEYGGDGERILYGYPDSVVKISYVPRVLITRYSIPLSIYFPYGDSRVSYPGSGLEVDYSLPPNSQPWYADWWVGYTFRDYSTYQNLYENGREFYSGPLGRYAIRVAYTRLHPYMMRPGENNVFEIRMTDGDSEVRNGDTRGIIKYFIQGFVGYGDIFPYLLQGYPEYRGYNLTYYGPDGESTVLVGDPPYKSLSVSDLDPEKYALDDAIIRLFTKLNYETSPDDSGPPGSQSNPIDVELTGNVRISFASMKNVPTLAPPIAITLRVWRGG